MLQESPPFAFVMKVTLDNIVKFLLSIVKQPPQARLLVSSVSMEVNVLQMPTQPIRLDTPVLVQGQQEWSVNPLSVLAIQTLVSTGLVVLQYQIRSNALVIKPTPLTPACAIPTLAKMVGFALPFNTPHTQFQISAGWDFIALATEHGVEPFVTSNLTLVHKETIALMFQLA